jgi:hypothetical protein
MDPEVRDGWIEELFLICFRSSTLWFYPTKNNDKYLYLVLFLLMPSFPRFYKYIVPKLTTPLCLDLDIFSYWACTGSPLGLCTNLASGKPYN